MKSTAAIAMLIFAGAMLTALFIQSSRERAASCEQARSQHEELMRRLARLEQILAAVPAERGDETHAAASAGLARDTSSTRERSTRAPAPADADPRTRAEHTERIQAGNTVIDRAIESGRWAPTDVAAFGVATNG